MVEWIKSHPYIVGATVVGLFILYLITRSSSSTSASAATGATPTDLASLQAQEVAAAAQQQQTQLQAQQQNDALNAGITQAQIAADAATLQTQYAAQVQMAQIGANLQLGLAQNSAGLTLGEVQAASPLALAGVTGEVLQTPNGVLFGLAQNQQQQQQQQTATQTAINTAVAASGSSAVTSAAASGTGTAGSLPGESYNAYMARVLGTSNPSPTDTGAVAARSSASPGAQTAWIVDPCSPHNVDYGNPATVPAACGGSSGQGTMAVQSLPPAAPARQLPRINGRTY